MFDIKGMGLIPMSFRRISAGVPNDKAPCGLGLAMATTVTCWRQEGSWRNGVHHPILVGVYTVD